MQQRISDEGRKESERSIDCVECQNGSPLVEPKFNTKTRKCYKYSTQEERAELLGIHGPTTLLSKYKETLEEIESVRPKGSWDDVVRAMRLCPFSWPFGVQEERAYEVIVRLSGEMSSSKPYDNLPYEDQPALYYSFFDIYNRAKHDYSNKGKS
jgi:hypothetical protein